MQHTIDYVKVEVGAYNTTTDDIILTNVTMAVVTMTRLRDDATYTKTVIVVNFFVMVVAPLLVLSVCHLQTYRTVRENTRRHNAISGHQRRDDAMAMLFFVIILCFVICHSGKFVLNFFEIWRILTGRRHEPWPMWAFLLTRTNHLLLVVNSSVNFFIYCFRDARFREAAMSILGVKRGVMFLFERGTLEEGCASQFSVRRQESVIRATKTSDGSAKAMTTLANGGGHTDDVDDGEQAEVQL